MTLKLKALTVQKYIKIPISNCEFNNSYYDNAVRVFAAINDLKDLNV